LCFPDTRSIIEPFEKILFATGNELVRIKAYVTLS